MSRRINRPAVFAAALTPLLLCGCPKTLTTPPEGHLRREFSMVVEHFIEYANADELPPDTLAGMMNEWARRVDPDDGQHPKYCKSLQAGTDPWGSPLVYEVDEETRIVTIRSIGRNLIDEHGKGDDVQRQYDMKMGATRPKRQDNR